MKAAVEYISLPAPLRHLPAASLTAPAPEPAPLPSPIILPLPILAPVPTASVQSPGLGEEVREKRERVSTSKIILILIVSLIFIGSLSTLAFFLLSGNSNSNPNPPISNTTPKPDSNTTPTPGGSTNEVVPKESKPGLDTDSDGLTNIEEGLYGTDFRSPDTDHDSFLDGNEVFHRYDPNGLAPSTLLDTGAVRVLDNVTLPFSLYYPASWIPTVDPSARSVTFKSGATTVVSISWLQKTDEATLTQFISDNQLLTEETNQERYITKEGIGAVGAKDGREVILDGGVFGYDLVYSVGSGQSIDYLQTFKMMVNSFKLK